MFMLRAHAVTEAFVIAANRQLSVLHPINKLLHPHFRESNRGNNLCFKVFDGMVVSNGQGLEFS
ncbi:hypothetical protein DVH24_021334 [Malus domestica]|uniref:Lipoxygenase domain-containing protein n=1 Tax=Malus domestica TaxID=3750 RepID=A0A498K1E7_MALDO|nr:hypothetical protein DVH24_021334 [Malus domestica]